MTLYTQTPFYRRSLRVQSQPPGFTLRYRSCLGQGSPRHPLLAYCMETIVNKTSRLDLRVTQEERQLIAQKAELAGLKMSEYLRRSALGIQAPGLTEPSSSSAILSKPERAQLASLANNLNQLTRYAHAGQLDLAGIDTLLHQLKHLLA